MHSSWIFRSKEFPLLAFICHKINLPFLKNQFFIDISKFSKYHHELLLCIYKLMLICTIIRIYLESALINIFTGQIYIKRWDSRVLNKKQKWYFDVLIALDFTDAFLQYSQATASTSYAVNSFRFQTSDNSYNKAFLQKKSLQSRETIKSLK